MLPDFQRSLVVGERNLLCAVLATSFQSTCCQMKAAKSVFVSYNVGSLTFVHISFTLKIFSGCTSLGSKLGENDFSAQDGKNADRLWACSCLCHLRHHTWLQILLCLEPLSVPWCRFQLTPTMCFHGTLVTVASDARSSSISLSLPPPPSALLSQPPGPASEPAGWPDAPWIKAVCAERGGEIEVITGDGDYSSNVVLTNLKPNSPTYTRLWINQTSH